MGHSQNKVFSIFAKSFTLLYFVDNRRTVVRVDDFVARFKGQREPPWALQERLRIPQKGTVRTLKSLKRRGEHERLGCVLKDVQAHQRYSRWLHHRWLFLLPLLRRLGLQYLVRHFRGQF